MTELKGEIESNTMIVGDFNTPLSIMNTFSRTFMSKIVYLVSDNLVWCKIFSWKWPSLWNRDNVSLPSRMNISNAFRLLFTLLKVSFSFFLSEKLIGASLCLWHPKCSSLIHTSCCWVCPSTYWRVIFLQHFKMQFLFKIIV